MTQLAGVPLSFRDLLRPERRRMLIALVILLTILWHILLLTLPWERLLQGSRFLSPPKVELTQIDPKDLARMKSNWAKKNLLLESSNAPTADSAPDNARYMSDRNVKVEKEMRARNSQVMPQKNRSAPAMPNAPEARPSTSAKSEQAVKKRLPVLSQLGIPMPRMKLQKTRPVPERLKALSANPAMPATGGDQTLFDESLPIGAENMLNSTRSQYFVFYSRIYREIGPLWQTKVISLARRKGRLSRDYVTQVQIVMNAQGEVIDRYVSISSGDSEFDQIALEVWRINGVFPNPPSELLDENGEFWEKWTFRVQGR